MRALSIILSTGRTRIAKKGAAASVECLMRLGQNMEALRRVKICKSRTVNRIARAAVRESVAFGRVS